MYCVCTYVMYPHALQASFDNFQGQINLAFTPQPSTQEENENVNSSLVGSFPLPNVAGTSLYEVRLCLVSLHIHLGVNHYYF